MSILSPAMMGIMSKPAAASGFSYSAIAGYTAHFDAAALTGYVDGDLVPTFTDKSGNGNHGTQTGTKRMTYKAGIINGLPILRADGVNDTYILPNIPHSSHMYIYAVIDTTSLGAGYRIFIDRAGTPSGDPAAYLGYNGGNYRPNIYSQGATGGAIQAANAVTQRLVLLRWKFEPTSFGTRRDSEAEVTHTVTGWPQSYWVSILLGGSQQAKIDIGEIVIYHRTSVMPSADDSAITADLKAKWGTP